VPLGELAALPLCLVHAVLGAFPPLERLSAVAGSGALVVVRSLAHAFAWRGLPMPAPSAEQLAALALAPALGRRRLVVVALLVVGLEIVVRIRGSPRRELRVTFLDVGQGDAALVDLPDGQALLIDGGGLVGSPIDVGRSVVLPVLAARRRRELVAVILTHPHPDHALGLRAVFDTVRVRSFWSTGQEAPPPFVREAPVFEPRTLCGAHLVGGALVEILAPCPLDPDLSANDNSFVLRVTYGERSFLFVGDAEREEERRLVAPRADVLKVGHHGSMTSSSPAFVAAVAPSFAVVSCGVRNRFGHPSATTLATLAAAGTQVLRTDRDGSVIVTTNGHDLRVRVTARGSALAPRLLGRGP